MLADWIRETGWSTLAGESLVNLKQAEAASVRRALPPLRKPFKRAEPASVCQEKDFTYPFKIDFMRS
ncbi:hypothetical protein CapIbe_000199 [Capra ibex]